MYCGVYAFGLFVCLALDVYQHNYFSGKNCPIFIRPRWGKFLEAVRGHFDGKIMPATPQTAQPAAADSIKDGDRVSIKRAGIEYYPGATIIPGWLPGMALTVAMLGERGGVPCALMREITTWCAVENLERV